MTDLGQQYCSQLQRRGMPRGSKGGVVRRAKMSAELQLRLRPTGFALRATAPLRGGVYWVSHLTHIRTKPSPRTGSGAAPRSATGKQHVKLLQMSYSPRSRWAERSSGDWQD